MKALPDTHRSVVKRGIKSFMPLLLKLVVLCRSYGQKSISGILTNMFLIADLHDSSINFSISESESSVSEFTFTIIGFLIHALLLWLRGGFSFRFDSSPTGCSIITAKSHVVMYSGYTFYVALLALWKSCCFLLPQDVTPDWIHFLKVQFLLHIEYSYPGAL